jgi:hypothetical protein
VSPFELRSGFGSVFSGGGGRGGTGGGLASTIAVAFKVKLGFGFIADSLEEVGGWRAVLERKRGGGVTR